jgi:hypothetical protein
VSERTAARLAGTGRSGTTTLAEMRAMRALGLEPVFARRLSPESLATRNQLAVLHVDEPIGAATIRHAVALLAVDARARTVTIGNPLSGRQVLPWGALRGYWSGEAVFVTRRTGG